MIWEASSWESVSQRYSFREEAVCLFLMTNEIRSCDLVLAWQNWESMHVSPVLNLLNAVKPGNKNCVASAQICQQCTVFLLFFFGSTILKMEPERKGQVITWTVQWNENISSMIRYGLYIRVPLGGVEWQTFKANIFIRNWCIRLFVENYNWLMWETDDYLAKKQYLFKIHITIRIWNSSSR